MYENEKASYCIINEYQLSSLKIYVLEKYDNERIPYMTVETMMAGRENIQERELQNECGENINFAERRGRVESDWIKEKSDVFL